MILIMMRKTMLLGAIPLFVAGVAASGRSDGAEEIAGPVPAEVVEVIDGDTIAVRAQVWLSLELTSHVRIRGIDTPELHSTCAAEKAMAAEARDRLAGIAGQTIRLTNITQDKYGGRVDADATTADGRDLGAAMLATGLARAYDGKGARADWCPVGSVVAQPK